MSRIVLRDPVAVRCFLNTMTEHGATPHFKKDGTVSNLSWIDIHGDRYDAFLKAYAVLRQTRLDWPDLPPVFEYLPVNFADVRDTFAILNAPHLNTVVGCPLKTHTFILQNAPCITDLKQSPFVTRCEIENVGLTSCAGLNAQAFFLTACPITDIEHIPARLRRLDIHDCPELRTLTGDPRSVENMEIVNVPHLHLDWCKFERLQKLLVNAALNQPDKDTLRRWLTTPFMFVPMYPNTPITFDPMAGRIPIPGRIEDPEGMPLWQSLLRLTRRETVDYLRLFAGYEELYGEPLVVDAAILPASPPAEISADSL